MSEELRPPEGAEDRSVHTLLDKKKREVRAVWFSDIQAWDIDRDVCRCPVNAWASGYRYHAPGYLLRLSMSPDATERARLEGEVARLRDMVRNAYNEGFSEGMREHSTSRGGKPWMDSTAAKKLEALRHDR